MSKKRPKPLRANRGAATGDCFSWEQPLHRNATRGAIDLKSTLSTLRSRLKPILEKISHYLPNLTDHTLLHIDNLRRVTDELIRPGALTALEVYCLNVAFLIHDACLSPVLYSEGPNAVRRSETYLQLVAVHLRSLGTAPSEQAVAKYADRHPDYADDPLFFATLRKTHASEAAKILAEFHKENVHLIDNSELRKTTSEICGPTAASHHLPHTELERKLSRDRSFPRIAGMEDFDADDLKVRDFYLATILRVADACQLEGRAPRWPRLLQAPKGMSKLHWDFQETLAMSFPASKDLVYKIFPGPCPLSKAHAWWMAYDYLHDVVAPELAAADRNTESTNTFRLGETRSCTLRVRGHSKFLIQPTVGNLSI